MVTTQPRIAVHSRWMIGNDMPEVSRISADEGKYAWREHDLRIALRKSNCVGSVAEVDGGKVAGFCVYELLNDRMHVTTLAVALNWRRRGVGTALVLRLIARLSVHRRKSVTVCVPESQLEALQFFKSVGFYAHKTLVGQFGNEDGILMKYTLLLEGSE